MVSLRLQCLVCDNLYKTCDWAVWFQREGVRTVAARVAGGGAGSQWSDGAPADQTCCCQPASRWIRSWLTAAVPCPSKYLPRPSRVNIIHWRWLCRNDGYRNSQTISNDLRHSSFLCSKNKCTYHGFSVETTYYIYSVLLKNHVTNHRSISSFFFGLRGCVSII